MYHFDPFWFGKELFGGLGEALERRERRPVGRTCPRCGGNRYQEVGTEVILGFIPDRRCKDCETVYHPPPPLAASIALLVMAGLAVLVGLPSIVVCSGLTYVSIRFTGLASVLTVLVTIFLALVCVIGGVLCLTTGLWGLWQHRRTR